MSKELEIKASRCLLVIDENELMGCLALKPDIFQRAIGRGKACKRAMACENRQAHVDRWQLYEWLKGNRIPENAASLVESMGAAELKEGVIEFILTIRRKDKHDDRD